MLVASKSQLAVTWKCNPAQDMSPKNLAKAAGGHIKQSILPESANRLLRLSLVVLSIAKYLTRVADPNSGSVLLAGSATLVEGVIQVTACC